MVRLGPWSGSPKGELYDRRGDPATVIGRVTIIGRATVVVPVTVVVLVAVVVVVAVVVAATVVEPTFRSANT
jgi:hypothetical protein